MTAARGRLRTGLAAPVLFVLAAVASFIALGTWQLERKAWKEALIETLDLRLAASPIPLPSPEIWSRLKAADDAQRNAGAGLLGLCAGASGRRRSPGRQPRFPARST